jgi:hypothetical protein
VRLNLGGIEACGDLAGLHMIVEIGVQFRDCAGNLRTHLDGGDGLHFAGRADGGGQVSPAHRHHRMCFDGGGREPSPQTDTGAHQRCKASAQRSHLRHGLPALSTD